MSGRPAKKNQAGTQDSVRERALPASTLHACGKERFLTTVCALGGVASAEICERCQHVGEGKPQDGQCINLWAALDLDKLREFEEPEMATLENDMREAVRRRDFSGLFMSGLRYKS